MSAGVRTKRFLEKLSELSRQHGVYLRAEQVGDNDDVRNSRTDAVLLLRDVDTGEEIFPYDSVNWNKNTKVYE